MPAVLLTEAWWRAHARPDLAPGRWPSARLLRPVLALTRACITAPWRWARLLPMPALVVTVASLLAGALASTAGLTAQAVPVTLALLADSTRAAESAP